jgi:hypothetical protein
MPVVPVVPVWASWIEAVPGAASVGLPPVSAEASIGKAASPAESAVTMRILDDMSRSCAVSCPEDSEETSR